MLRNDSVSLICSILKNEIPWKSWLDPRFLRNSKSKWTLKWLPLDRGYFKFHFCKGKSILIILCRTYFWTFEFVILFQVVFVLPCISSLLNATHFRIIDRQSLEKKVAWKLWLDPRFPCHPKWEWNLNWLPLDRGPFKFIFTKKGHLIPKYVTNCAHPFLFKIDR